MKASSRALASERLAASKATAGLSVSGGEHEWPAAVLDGPHGGMVGPQAARVRLARAWGALQLLQPGGASVLAVTPCDPEADAPFHWHGQERPQPAEGSGLHRLAAARGRQERRPSLEHLRDQLLR